MPSPRRALRLTRLLVHVAVGVALAATLLGRRHRRGRPRFERVIGWWSRGVCRILGVELRVHGQPARAPALLLSNHVSWLDIPVLAAVVPGRFLSKAEVRAWPVFGWLAARAGTLFLRRGDRQAAEAAVLEMVWALRQGDNVILFPEGTTSDGTTVRRFRGRLLEAAQLAGVPVQPVALRFLDRDLPHPAVPFLGDDALVPHVLRLAAHRRLRAEVTFLEPIPARGQERGALARHCEQAVRAVVAGGAPMDAANRA